MLRVDQTCNLPDGYRDSIHVPFVVAEMHHEAYKDATKQVVPGQHVKFINVTDDFELTEGRHYIVIPCAKEEAHGLANPFIDDISMYDRFMVMLFPGIAGETSHTFDIRLKGRIVERTILESQLAQQKTDDPACAGCWHIRNNRLERS